MIRALKLVRYVALSTVEVAGIVAESDRVI
jgi:hypothetical protein